MNAPDAVERLRVRTDASERYGRDFVEYLLADDARAILDHIAALTAERDAAVAEVAQIVAYLKRRAEELSDEHERADDNEILTWSGLAGACSALEKEADAIAACAHKESGHVAKD